MVATAAKPGYSPREVGTMLNPPRSGQYVRVRIHRGEIQATQLPGGDFEISWQEVRRLTGLDLTTPGHEGVSSARDDRVRALRRLHAETLRLCAEMGEILAELEG